MRRTGVWMLLAGCGGRDPIEDYVGCDPEDPEVECTEGNECATSHAVANVGAGGWCSRSCFVGSGGCPPDPDGAPTDCFEPDGTEGGQCYVTCEGDAPCPAGTMCATLTQEGVPVLLCLPT